MIVCVCVRVCACVRVVTLLQIPREITSHTFGERRGESLLQPSLLRPVQGLIREGGWRRVGGKGTQWWLGQLFGLGALQVSKDTYIH